MDFVTSVKTCLGKYVTFAGRARRSEYWWFVLFTLLCSVVAQIGGDALEGLVSLVLFLPSLAAAARRLHDTDRSAWWLLLFFLPVIGWLILIYFYVQRGTVGPNQYGPDSITGEAGPARRSRGAPTEFDRVMDDSYQKSRVPRAGDPD
jgi:uncharacterized membrane protein YhaH (DUF805 family)